MATGIEKSEDSGFFDIGCDHRDYCSLCNFKKVPRLSLRGGCPESHIDTQYVLIFDETHDGFSKLIGSSVSKIRFADWKILQTFLGPRRPLELPLVAPYALKILTPIYRHICLMNNHE